MTICGLQTTLTFFAIAGNLKELILVKTPLLQSQRHSYIVLAHPAPATGAWFKQAPPSL
jgi:hypothetical protein